MPKETSLSCNCFLVITKQNVSVCLVNISACAFDRRYRWKLMNETLAIRLDSSPFRRCSSVVKDLVSDTCRLWSQTVCFLALFESAVFMNGCSCSERQWEWIWKNKSQKVDDCGLKGCLCHGRAARWEQADQWRWWSISTGLCQCK